ncbi:MAG: hypothetical protein LBR36_06740 [Bacteroidales bacterium]|jgi:antitoxin component YwqK of YwqJK toxin-antitoxin module|nr:hypothetical protein [Bacteroidales bacterium]
MINSKKILLFSLSAIIILLSACTEKREKVSQTYADGLPRKTEEYIVKDGKEVLFKETFYFPATQKNQKQQKYIEGTYDETSGNRDKTWTSWFDNGQKNSELTYSDGKENGIYHVWYRNGQLRISGQYKEGKQVGKWFTYDSLGNVTSEKTF